MAIQSVRHRTDLHDTSAEIHGTRPKTKPNLRDLERSYLVADLGGCRYGALDVLATWCCPARRRRRSRRSIDAQTAITLPTSLGLHLQCPMRRFRRSRVLLGRHADVSWD